MADQWNENNPAVGNQIANDIPDIKENLEFIKDIFESQGMQTWSDSTATTMFPTTMKDGDADTMIQLDEGGNDGDVIRFDCEGSQLAKIDGNGLNVNDIVERTAAHGVEIDGLTIKDGTITTANSIDSAQYVDGSIDTAHLNTTLQTDSHTGDTGLQEVTLTGGSYCFFPQVKSSNATQTVTLTYGYTAKTVGTTYFAYAAYQIAIGTAYTAYLCNRYVTGSGPVFWAFGLLNKKLEKVTRWNVAIDHPCFGNGGDPSVIQHPFFNYDKEKFQLVVSNPGETQLDEYKKLAFKENISLNDFLIDHCEFDLSRSEEWTKEKVTVNTFPDVHDVAIGAEVQRLLKPVPKLKDALVLPITLKE